MNPILVAGITWYYREYTLAHTTSEAHGILTTGVNTGTETCIVTVRGRGCTTDRGTAETTNAVPTGMGDVCATAVVAHWQWQVGTTKNEFMGHMID